MHLLASWFNRGFLVLRRIDWHTPAAILEKIIAYEAVHEIQGWDDLRRRLDPADRRCFAFFHPSLIDEPLIFVEVALMSDMPDSIQSLLREAPKNGEPTDKPTTAVFYSISNCQEGLRGISFGNFLIKQVVEDLVKERASLKTFVTLSPVPGFADWLERGAGRRGLPLSSRRPKRERLRMLEDPAWIDTAAAEPLKPVLLRLAAHYFLHAKTAEGHPVDPVARFHLGNGARLERINWQGDISAKGLREAHGLMCNYRYELKDIEKNHEAYENEGTVAASRHVHALLKQSKPERARPEAGSRFLALPGLRTARSRPPAGRMSELAPQHRGSPMRYGEGDRESENVEDRRGEGGGRFPRGGGIPIPIGGGGLSISSLRRHRRHLPDAGHQPAGAAEQRRRHPQDAGHSAPQPRPALAVRGARRAAGADSARGRRDDALRAPRAGRHRGRVGARVPGRRQRYEKPTLVLFSGATQTGVRHRPVGDGARSIARSTRRSTSILPSTACSRSASMRRATSPRPT